MQLVLPTFALLLSFLILYPTFLLRKLSRQRVRSDANRQQARQKGYYRPNTCPDDRC